MGRSQRSRATGAFGAFVAVVALAAVAVACGDDDGADEGGAASAETTADAGAAGDGASAEGTTPGSGAVVTGGDEGSGGSTEGTVGSRSGDVCTPERAGGQLVALAGSPFATVDPAQIFGTGGYGADYASAMFGSLIFYNAETHEYEPYIATSWESNADRSEWTVEIRDDVTFGNGDPFTVDHISRWIEYFGQSGRTRGARLASQITTRVADDHTIVVSSDSGFNLPFLFSADVGWIPNMDIYEQRGEAFGTNAKGAGAGAYEFQRMSAAPGESLVLVAKDDWWGGPVCIERIEFRNVVEPAASVESFLLGEADTVYLGDSDMLEPVRQENEDLLVYSELVGSLQWVFADQGVVNPDSPFKDVRIREAMQAAFDYDVIYERMHNGEGPRPTSAIIPEGSPYYRGQEGPPTDLEHARELVQETIDEGVWDGSFEYLSPPAFESDAVVMKAMWEAAGMQVQIDLDPNALTRMIAQPDYEVAALGFAITPSHPFTNLSNLYCDSPGNRTGYCEPEMDAALDGLRAAITIEENADALETIQEIWNRTYPYAIFNHTEWGIGAHEHVKGLRFGSDNTPYYDTAYIER